MLKFWYKAKVCQNQITGAVGQSIHVREALVPNTKIHIALAIVDQRERM